MKKYKATLGWCLPEAKVVEVEVERETNSSVWIDGQRRAKRTTYDNYYDTFEEAKAALLECAQGKVGNLRNQLERAKGTLGNIKGLKGSLTRR